MKKLLFTLAFLTPIFGMLAQDTILKFNGEKIIVKIQEIGTENVKFKKQSNLDGPLYVIAKSEIQELNFKNGSKETFQNSTNNNSQDNDSRKAVFIKTTANSDAELTQIEWKREIEKFSQLKLVNSQEESDLIFEFQIKKAMGESRVKVTVYNTKDNTLVLESKKYRGTTNAFNRMGPSIHGIRKCISKGVIPKLDE